MSRILNCPFCGGNPEITDATKMLGVWRLLHRCKIIGPMSLEHYSRQGLVTAWNTRADLPPTDAEVMAHPKVKALVEAAEEQLYYLEMCGEDGDLVRNLRSAIAAIQEAKP